MRGVIGLLVVSALTACPGAGDPPVPLPPVPDRLDAVAGDGLALPAGDEVEVVVRVTGQGRPVAGVALTFQVLSGGGAADTSATGPSDAGGLVRARWRLGLVLTTNFLAARTAGGLQVVFAVVGVAGPAAVVEKIGDRQFVAAGTTVTVAFRLRDRLGNRAPGAPATCTVAAGGGTASAIAPADPGWDGACAWTTGATPRVENLLTVSAGTAAPATFTTWTGVPSPITVSTASTLEGRTVLAYAPVGIRWVIAVDSPLEVASVTAFVAGQASPLVKGAIPTSPLTWSGFTPGDAFQRGPLVARVTAVDVRGTEGDLYLWFDVDRPAVITITAPLDQSLARTEVAVEATCQDDDPVGCTSLTASIDTGVGTVLEGTSSIAGTIPLAGLQPMAVGLNFVARDSTGRISQEARTVWLEPSAHLVEVGAAPGLVLDATTTAALFRLPGLVGLADLATGATTASAADPGEAQAGFLAPGGAAWVGRQAGSTDLEALVWAPPGEPLALGRVPLPQALAVAGPWLLVSRGPGLSATELVRRDLATGAEVVVTTGATTFSSALAADGDVVFVSDADLWRYRDGPAPLVRLTQDGQARERPATDAGRALYVKEVAPGDRRVTLRDDGDHPLGEASACTAEPCLALSGAWAAFVGPSPAGLPQLWRSGPAGLEQVTFFDQPSTLEALAPDGTVFLLRGATRYRSAPGDLDPQPVGSANGRVVIRDGKALVLLGRSVLEVVP